MPTYFEEFLTSIRPTKSQRDDLRDGHKLLRERIAAFDGLKSVVAATFLQGSYRRATAVRPKDDSRSDVDIVVVTNIDNTKTTPQEALDVFKPFLKEYYPGKWEQNSRSLGIELSAVKMDLVVTAKPSDADLNIIKSRGMLSDYDIVELSDLVEKKAMSAAEKADPLLIPDSDVDEWQKTHPLEQIRWTQEKNGKCNGHYVNVVKAIKWWRLVNHPTPKHPKGYPLEHIVGECCPDGIESVAEGVARTLEAIAARYKPFTDAKSVPFLKDRGVEQNVLARITPEEFAEFREQAETTSKIARAALDSASFRTGSEKWHEIFGDKFRIAEEDKAALDGLRKAAAESQTSTRPWRA
jgi:predicted nucleotidyltransferase